MDINLQLIINNNYNLKKYLRDNSYWYKELVRNPSSIKYMEDEMKSKYKLRGEDKIKKVSKELEMIQSLVDIFK